MANVANKEVHLHLEYTEVYQCPAHGKFKNKETKKSEDTYNDEKDKDKDYASGRAYTNLSAAFSKTLATADATPNTASLRQAANAFASLVNGDPFMEEEQDERNGEMEGTASVEFKHTFMDGEDSPWNIAVQGVVNSVNAMANSATRIRDHTDTDTIPSTVMALPATVAPSLGVQNSSEDGVNSVPAAIVDTVQAQFSAQEVPMPHSAPGKRRWSFSWLTPFRMWRARRWRVQPASVFSISAPFAPSNDVSLNLHSRPGIPEKSLQHTLGLSTGTITPTHSMQVQKERIMTIQPLLIPPKDVSISAHRLASLYFMAIVDSNNIPEFVAEYVLSHGQCCGIILTFKNMYDADRLKESWDSSDRSNTRVPELEKVTLYRGNIFVAHADMAVRDAALDELASFKLAPGIMT